MPDLRRIADYLATDPRVARVAYPGLPDGPQHGRAATQLRGGSGGVVSFAIAGTHQDRVRFVNDPRVSTSAVSLTTRPSSPTRSTPKSARRPATHASVNMG